MIFRGRYSSSKNFKFGMTYLSVHVMLEVNIHHPSSKNFKFGMTYLNVEAMFKICLMVLKSYIYLFFKIFIYYQYILNLE